MSEQYIDTIMHGATIIGKKVTNVLLTDCEITVLDSGLPGCDSVAGFVARDVSEVSKKTRLSAS